MSANEKNSKRGAASTGVHAGGSCGSHLASPARRKLLYETIADGCRASLQVMIARSIETANSNPSAGEPCGWVKCSRAVHQHMDRSEIPPELKEIMLPGGNGNSGPGLWEICDNCCLWRGTERAQPQSLLLGGRSQLGPGYEFSLMINSTDSPWK
jgi:hypothetical protein